MLDDHVYPEPTGYADSWTLWYFLVLNSVAGSDSLASFLVMSSAAAIKRTIYRIESEKCFVAKEVGCE